MVDISIKFKLLSYIVNKLRKQIFTYKRKHWNTDIIFFYLKSNLENHTFSFFVYTDLTTFYGYRGSLNFPLRPPSPFADSHAGNGILSQHNEDTDTHGTVIWSSPVKPQSLSFKINNTDNPVLSSSSQPASVTRANSIWRRTFRKLLKRTKSVERKKCSLDFFSYYLYLKFNFSCSFNSVWVYTSI
jgi:hypothetical protein